MRRVLKIVWGRLLMAAGTGATGIGALFIDPKQNEHFKEIGRFVPFFGWGCLALGIAEAIWAVVDALASAGRLASWDGVRDRFGQLVYFHDYETQFWTASDILYWWSKIEDVARRAMGKDFSHGTLTKEMMIAHASKNSQFMFALLDRNSDLVGFLNIISLNRAATRAVMSGGIHSGREIRPEHACKSFRDASGMYVAGVYAIDWRSRGALLALLKFIMRSRARESRSLQGVFARGATTNGKRLIQHYHFISLETNPEIWFLPRDRVLT